MLWNTKNDPKSGNNLEKIASNIVNLGLPIKNEKTIVYISSLVINNDKLIKKRKEVHDFMKQQCLTNYLLFLDDESIDLEILNKSGLHLNENITKWSVNIFCFSMTKWNIWNNLSGYAYYNNRSFFEEKRGKQKFMFWSFYSQHWRTYNYLL